jgi:hypothetical protein
LVSIIDDALPPALFRSLKRRIVGLSKERVRSTYQTTFWFDLAERPQNLVELAVSSIRPHLRPQKALGVEWWLSRMRTSNVKIDFHVDRDNHLFAETKRLSHPLISSLLYLNRCRGGLLAVTREPPNQTNLACAPDRLSFDFVEPKPNRFTFFDGTLTHGVLDSLNELPGKRRKTEPDFRLAIAMNFWARRPRKIPKFSEGNTYRALAI